MEILGIIVAGIAGWAFGAAWYGMMSKPWMAASSLTTEQVSVTNKGIYAVSLVMAIVVAAMMQYIFARSGVDTFGLGLLSGLGLGAFIALPWLVNNVLFSLRDPALIWLDGIYVVGASTIIGAVLMLF